MGEEVLMQSGHVCGGGVREVLGWEGKEEKCWAYVRQYFLLI